jgi:hypothetical protein
VSSPFVDVLIKYLQIFEDEKYFILKNTKYKKDQLGYATDIRGGLPRIAPTNFFFCVISRIINSR